jgi:hypothetical protein
MRRPQYDEVVSMQWQQLCMKRLEDPTITNIDLANEIGVNPRTIAGWLKNPRYVRYEHWATTTLFAPVVTRAVATRASFQERVRERGDELQDRLFAIIEETSDPKLEASLTQDLLDRADIGARTTALQGGSSYTVTADALRYLVETAQEIGLPALPGEVVQTDGHSHAESAD